MLLIGVCVLGIETRQQRNDQQYEPNEGARVPFKITPSRRVAVIFFYILL